jgi:cyclic pyranopterin phosphate synthase
MQDSFGRPIQYLRFSLTSACQMRCVYCRPTVQLADDCDSSSSAGSAPLSASEIEAITRHLVENHGLRKVRLTGGDPTARRDLVEIIERIARIEGVDDLAMTTNGLRLASHARVFAEAGLQRVNISLDTLDSARFERMTGVAGLDRVFEAIDSAKSVGLNPIKLNTVVVRNENEDDLPSLVRFAASHGAEIRFIELMPMGPLASEWADRYVPESEMRAILDPHVRAWIPRHQGSDSARCFEVELKSADGAENCDRSGGPGGCGNIDGTRPPALRARVGFITPMSCNFCADCNRIRLTARGDVFPCLMDEPRGNILEAVRPAFDPTRFDALIRQALSGKAAEHPSNGPVAMIRIGG